MDQKNIPEQIVKNEVFKKRTFGNKQKQHLVNLFTFLPIKFI